MTLQKWQQLALHACEALDIMVATLAAVGSKGPPWLRLTREIQHVMVACRATEGRSRGSQSAQNKFISYRACKLRGENTSVGYGKALELAMNLGLLLYSTWAKWLSRLSKLTHDQSIGYQDRNKQGLPI